MIYARSFIMSIIQSSRLLEDNVCARCRSIPWEEIARPSWYHRQVTELQEFHEQLISSRCRVCRCLARIKPSSLDGKPCSLMQCYAEKAFGLGMGVRRGRPLRSSHLLYVTDSDAKPFEKCIPNHGALGIFKADREYDVGVQRMDPSVISSARVRECVAHCRTNHETCVRKLFPATSISRLRVIDCNDPMRKVIRAPAGCKYVALSYVWGYVSRSSSTQYPRAIEDAITVTLMMEMQYLWVDAYCIDQNDEWDKHRQISQMGSIYANSEVTLVAAAGADSTYGLPGVSRPRRQQGDATIHGVTLLEAFPHAFHAVKQSVWASRGWTFQEAFLSPRRLIFTDDAVSFLCDRMYLAEWERIPLHAVPPGSASLFRRIIPTAFDDTSRDQEAIKARRRMRKAELILREYSGRQLSYGCDALGACLGVIKMLEGMGVYSVWGVPAGNTRYPQLMVEWFHQVPTRRRHGFPSWSYLGWEGKFDIEYEHPPRFPLWFVPFRVLIKGDGENPCFGGNQVCDTVRQVKGLGDRAPCYLHVEASMVDVKLKDIQWTGKEKSHRTIALGVGGSQGQYVTPPSGLYASLKISAGKRLAGIQMLVGVYADEAYLRPGPAVGAIYSSSGYLFNKMLLFQKDGGYYRRVGALKWKLTFVTVSKAVWGEYAFDRKFGHQVKNAFLGQSLRIEGVEIRNIIVK
ncbi:HET-domain-containing protein [Hypoxylon sp. FL1150]|nr:HET-domain-containing protein [Hypoxylon sp. FL1150]